VVFRYLPQTSDLGIQYDPRVLSPGRFIQYVGLMQAGALFGLEPIVRDDMWERFQAAPVRKLSISVARPTHVERLDRGPAAAATGSIRDMADAYDAPKITIELSMGTKKGGLAEAAKGIVRHFRREAIDDQADVTRMKAKITEDDGSREIDLLEDILSVKQELALEDNDPDANYDIKVEALRQAMNEWIR
jgi:hypothetical protein